MLSLKPRKDKITVFKYHHLSSRRTVFNFVLQGLHFFYGSSMVTSRWEHSSGFGTQERMDIHPIKMMSWRCSKIR